MLRYGHLHRENSHKAQPHRDCWRGAARIFCRRQTHRLKNTSRAPRFAAENDAHRVCYSPAEVFTAGERTWSKYGVEFILERDYTYNAWELPTLVSGAIYSVAFNCADAATNAAATSTQTNVTFDNTPPAVSIQNLRQNSTVHTGHVIGPAMSLSTIMIVHLLQNATRLAKSLCYP